MLHTITKQLEICIDILNLAKQIIIRGYLLPECLDFALEIIALALENFLENNKRQGGRLLGTQE